MAVTETVDFPAQPTDGFYRLTMLGGKGVASPRFEAVARVSVAGDASGGAVAIQMNLDNTYAWLVNSIQVRIEGETADVDSLIRLSAGGPAGAGDSDIQQVVQVCKFADVSPSGNTNFGLWTPAPMLMDLPDDLNSLTPTNRDMQVQSVWDNAGALRTYRCSIRAYAYLKGAKFNTDLERLVGPLSRGTGMTLN